MQQRNKQNRISKLIKRLTFRQLRSLTATILLWTTCFPAHSFARNSLVQSTTDDKSTLIAQVIPANAAQFYQQAVAELPEEFYVLYRIVDQIARANGLDERPWRVDVSPEYDINAFATDVNLVVVYAGLFDHLQGDSDAVACVVAHEIAHNAQRHIAVSAVERAEIEKRLYAEAVARAEAEAEDAQDDATGARVGGGILGAVGNAVGGLIGNAATVAGGAISQEGDRRIARAKERIEAIYKAALAQKEQEWAELSRRQEFEADAVGYQYMATAGFDPQGCLRVMDVLNRLPGTQVDGSHPATPARIEALKQLISQKPASTLAAEGRANLAANPRPLTYALSRDGTSLRINSRHEGGNGWSF